MKRTLVILSALAFAVPALAGQNAGARPSLDVPGTESGRLKNDVMEVRVDISQLNAGNAVHFDLEYDTQGLAFEGWEAGDLFADPLVFGPFDRTEQGVVDVTVATLHGAVTREKANVGVVRFRVIDPERSDVRLRTFHTGDENWQPDTIIDLGKGVGTLPTSAGLIGNAPNPFNPTTKIRYALPNAAPVSLQIIDVSGRVVRTLVNGVQSAGEKEVTWNGKTDGGKNVSSGVYFMFFEADGKKEQKKMTLIR